MNVVWLFVLLYRLINAWIVRTQFDPDEYWQTLEPAYCLVFGVTDGENNGPGSPFLSTTSKGMNDNHGCALTWEWTRRWNPPSSLSSSSAETVMQRLIQPFRTAIVRALHGPVRSYVSILPTYSYYLACRSLFNWANHDDDKGNNYSTSYFKQFIYQHSTYIISKGPVFLHAVLISATTDLSVWFIAYQMNNLESPFSPATAAATTTTTKHDTSWPFWALVCSITSWFNGYALTRTYANSFETMCLLVGISLLGPELFGQSQSSSLNSIGKHGHSLRAKFAFILGGLSVCVRFTSLAAWIPIGLIISSKFRDYKCNMSILFGLCFQFGLLGVILGCCIDFCFYGFWAIPFLGNIHFNVLLGKGSLYGTHPFLWYAYAGIPAICGIMFPFFLWETATIKSGSRLVLLGIITPYIALHSFSGHKEFRFLLPVLPLICILVGHALHRLVSVIENGKVGIAVLMKHCTPTKLVVLALILLNYPHLIYLSIMHQRGPIAVNEYLSAAIKKEAYTVQNEIKARREYSIHYLTGCHSTPSYSHLHIPNVHVSAWHLDCSPNCRSQPELICESDAFLNDPLGFVVSTYIHSFHKDCVAEENVVCDEVDDARAPPSGVVVMQDDAEIIDIALLEKLKMSHIASIRHTVKTISWHDKISNASGHEKTPSYNRYHDAITLFSMIDIHFDHFELYFMH